MKNIGKKYWPIGILILLEIILFATNFTRGTWLLGWDNMVPEFNFPLNFKRTFFSVWQEYRGLGLMDGMSHAANLVHYSIIWLLSLVFPTNILRYIYVFGTHLVGGIGVYVLIYNLQFSIFNKFSNSNDKNIKQIIAFVGAVFYQYCFATIQTFYLPFEVFITHFAFLPWLIFSALQLLHHLNWKHIALFSFLSFLATPQAHVPTVFIVYIATLAFLLLWNLFQTRFRSAKTVGIIILLTITTNAFWGLPFTYSALSRANTITVSKNNQTATEDTYQKNHAFGDIGNTALMRSFALTYVQYDHTKQQTTLMMEPWIDLINTSWATICQWVLFGIILAGIIGSILTKQRQLYPFVVLYLLVFSIIGNDIPVLKIIPELLRKYIPLFSDIFRFVFTKFFVLYALLSSIFIAVGIQWILSCIRSIHFKKIIILTIICIIGVTTYPSFTGNFLHKNLRVQIPDEYNQVFTYFQSQDPNKRVLVLPAPWFWAWTQYRWGTIGSGFTWFGIPQPTLDRAFDPWSQENENLYWELSQITYSGNASQFQTFLQKYNISYILLDDQIMHPVNDKALYVSALESMISEYPALSKEKQFGRISIYKIQNSIDTSFVTIAKQLPNVGPLYEWNDRDQASIDNGTYMTDNSKMFDVMYPLRSLFTGRTQDERTFTVTENDEKIIITNKNESIPSTPFAFDKTVIYDSTVSGILAQPIHRCDTKTDGSINAQQTTGGVTVSAINASGCIDIYLPDIYQRFGYLLAIVNHNVSGKSVYLSITNKDTKRTFLETELPKFGNDTQSSYFVIPPMDNYGMGYSINLNVISLGKDPSVNEISRVILYQIPYEEMVGLSSLNDRKIASPSARNDNNLDSRLRGNDPSAGSEQAITVEHPNPAYYRVNFQFPISNFQSNLNESNIKIQTNTLILSQAWDEGWRAYVINNPIIKSSNNPIIQWIYNTFPFIFGTEIKEHVLVNNWKNGWILPSAEISNNTNNQIIQSSNETSQTVIVFFLPQLLQYFGFFLLPIPLFFLLARPKL